MGQDEFALQGVGFMYQGLEMKRWSDVSERLVGHGMTDSQAKRLLLPPSANVEAFFDDQLMLLYLLLCKERAKSSSFTGER